MTEQRDGSPPAGRSPPASLTFKQRLKQKKKHMGRYVSPDAEELAGGNVVEDGASVIHQLYGRMVTLHPGNIIKKSGRTICLQEADALRVAEAAGLPVPHVHGTETTSDGRNQISMSYVEGQTLSDVWAGLSGQEQKAIARQLRDILVVMRSIPPPPGVYIGGCDGKQIRDGGLYTTDTAPSCNGEEAFNDYLLSRLLPKTPTSIRKAFTQQLRTNHRIVFTHADLAPRNIIIRDNKIVGIIDWENAGWYPEYWEYVKFFQHIVGNGLDWIAFAEDIHPFEYPAELVDYIALSKWQGS